MVAREVAAKVPPTRRVEQSFVRNAEDCEEEAGLHPPIPAVVAHWRCGAFRGLCAESMPPLPYFTTRFDNPTDPLRNESLGKTPPGQTPPLWCSSAFSPTPHPPLRTSIFAGESTRRVENRLLCRRALLRTTPTTHDPISDSSPRTPFMNDEIAAQGACDAVEGYDD